MRQVLIVLTLVAFSFLLSERAMAQVYLCHVNDTICGVSANPQPGDSRFDVQPTDVKDPTYQAWLVAPPPPLPVSVESLAAALIAKGVLVPADLASANAKP